MEPSVSFQLFQVPVGIQGLRIGQCARGLHVLPADDPLDGYFYLLARVSVLQMERKVSEGVNIRGVGAPLIFIRQVILCHHRSPTKWPTGMSLVSMTMLGTCLADNCFLMLACTCLMRSGVNSMSGTILRKRTTLSSMPSLLFWATQRLSEISLKLSTGMMMMVMTKVCGNKVRSYRL